MAENTADFVAGWASGAVAPLCTQPVDLVITRLQAGAFCSRTSSASNAPLRSRHNSPAYAPSTHAAMFGLAPHLLLEPR